MATGTDGDGADQLKANVGGSAGSGGRSPSDSLAPYGWSRRTFPEPKQSVVSQAPGSGAPPNFDAHHELLTQALSVSEAAVWYSVDGASGPLGDWWSPQACRILGLDPSRGPSRAIRFWRGLIHHSDRRAALQWLHRLRTGASSAPSEVQFRLRRRSDELHWVRVRARRLPTQDKGVVMLVGTIEDVTEQHGLTDRYLEERRSNQVLQEHSQDGVFTARDGRLVSLNRRFADLIGYTVSDLMGADVDKIVAPEDRAMVRQRYQQRIQGENPPPEYEFNLLHKDGLTRVPVRMSVGIADIAGGPVSIGTLKPLTDLSGFSRALSDFVVHADHGVAIV